MRTQARLKQLENAKAKSTPQKYVGPFDHLPIFCQMAPQCSDASWIKYAKPIAIGLVSKGYMPEGFQHLPDHFLCRWARLTGARLRAHDQRDDVKERQAECDERELFAEIRAFAAEQLRQEQVGTETPGIQSLANGRY